jgi:hypothetical protein
MRRILATIAIATTLWPTPGKSDIIGYNFTITTAYAAGDPFPNRIDSAFTEPDTGYLEIANTGHSAFSGLVGTIAISSFAGDLSFTSNPLILAPGAAVSIAIPDNSANVGGFNGPYYYYRPGVEITIQGAVSNGQANEDISLLVADRDIHSGVPRTDQYGNTSDSFVLQGGDLWGFDTGAAFGLSQADGVYVFQQVPEPGSLTLLAVAVTGVAATAAVRPARRHRKRQALSNRGAGS